MGYEIPTMYFVVIFVLCIVIGLFLLVLMGNLIVLVLLSKIGIPVYSNKIKKDFKMLKKVSKKGKAWIEIPGVCYAPIMEYADGYYSNHNYIGKFSVYGELVLSADKKSEYLQQFALNLDNGIPDLSIIKGSPKGKYEDLRHTNFSILRKIKQRMSENTEYEIVIQDDIGKHSFKPVAFLEIERGKNPVFVYSSRESFIKSLMEIADFRTEYREDKKCIMLECNTGIDTVVVLLNEK